MAGKEKQVVTAYPDAESAQAIREIARAESRSVAQVAGTALKLYALLSGDVRSALRELEGDEEALRRLVHQIGRVVRADRFEAAARRLAQSLPEDLSIPEDEAAILTMAVKVVNEAEDRP